MLEVPLHPAGHQQAAGPIPPGSTAVHLLPAVPIPAGLTGVVRGAAAALSPKRPGRHPRLGTLASRSPWVGSPPPPGWPPGAGRKAPTCWSRAPCVGRRDLRLPLPSVRQLDSDRPHRRPHADVPQPEAPTSNPEPATAPPDARTAVRPPTGPGLRRQVCADQGQGPCDRPAGSIFRRTPTFIRIA
jgi:hypothetical protein